MRAAADVTGMKTASHWQHYENDKADRSELPADLVIRLLRAWTGKGSPPITESEILEFSPILMDLMAEQGASYASTATGASHGVKVSMKVEGRSIDEVSKFMKSFSRCLAEEG